MFDKKEKNNDPTPDIVNSFIGKLTELIKVSSELKKIYLNTQKYDHDVIMVLSTSPKDANRRIASHVKEWVEGSSFESLKGALSKSIGSSCFSAEDFDKLVKTLSVPALMHGKEAPTKVETLFKENPVLLVIRAMQLITKVP